MNIELWDEPSREFVRLMITYAIGYGYKDADLKSIGGYESSQFYPTLAKIVKSTKRFVDIMRKDRQSQMLPEHRSIKQEDHIHHIYISNNERHVVTVTCDTVTLMTLGGKPQLPTVFIDLPDDQGMEEDEEASQEEATHHDSYLETTSKVNSPEITPTKTQKGIISGSETLPAFSPFEALEPKENG